MAKKTILSSGPSADNPFAAALSQALGGYTPDPTSAVGSDEEPNEEGHALRGWVHIGYEKKGRAGKTVTTLEFVDLEAAEGGSEAAASGSKNSKPTAEWVVQWTVPGLCFKETCAPPWKPN